MKLVIGENDIKTLYPDLITEWDFESNVDAPSSFTQGSHKKVWWKCKSCGGRWQAEIHSRVAGNGCPFCKGARISNSKRKLKSGNSLQDKDPQIAALWHPTKNGATTPEMINAGTNDKYWWKCELGHEWEARVSSIRSSHGNCPICMNELGTSFPEQAVFYYVSNHFYCSNREKISNHEIDIFIPEKNIGIEYDGSYYHKTKGEADRKKEQELKKLGITLYRIRESDRDGVEGNCINVMRSSSSKQSDVHLQWAISNLLALLGAEIKPGEIDLDRDAIRIYSQYIVSRKENSLKAKYPLVAAEWDYTLNCTLTPEMVSAGSQKIVWWNCEKGHNYKASISSRIRYYKEGKKFGCPYCSGHKVLRGFNDLQTVNPVLAEEWCYEKNRSLLPSDVTAGSKKKVWWKCRKCGTEWESTVSNRNLGRGCPTCKWGTISSKLVSKNTERNNLQDKYPEIAKDWDFIKNMELHPANFAPHSNKRVWWKCKECGYEWNTSINNRVNGTGCPSCARKSNGVRCRSTNEEFLAKMQEKGNPNVIVLGEYQTNKSKLPCKCVICNYEWETTPRSLLNGSGCPKCRTNRRSIIKSES